VAVAPVTVVAGRGDVLGGLPTGLVSRDAPCRQRAGHHVQFPTMNASTEVLCLARRVHPDPDPKLS
jgi:NAD(P)H-hydrate repair Nnr-like enzyme with NAD(P)H-hydrate dehydratase domain